MREILKACNLIKSRLQHWCFPLNFAKSLKTAFFKNNSFSSFLIMDQVIDNVALPSILILTDLLHLTEVMQTLQM